ncbi:MAG: hypothetical protein ACRCZI_11760 [Cetobacterium sp.]
MKGHQSTGVTEYFPVLGNSFSNGVLLEMIITGRAKPLPPDLCEIMDHSHCWGRAYDAEWYNEVVELLYQSLNNGQEIERTELVSILISPLVLKEIHANHAVDSVMEHLLVLDWMKWYLQTYNKRDRTSFRTIAVASVTRIKWSIAQVNSIPVIVVVASNSA